jgi:hypothetical protein
MLVSAAYIRLSDLRRVISEGSSVSWLLDTLRYVSAVRAPMSEGSAVNWFSDT